MFSFGKILFILAWVVLGAAIGLLIAWSQYNRGSQWRKLGELPDIPERIVGGTLWGVWVECRDGRLHYLSAHNVSQGGWSESVPPVESQRQKAVLVSRLRSRPRALENEIDSMEIIGWREGDLLYSKYAVRADGSVLVWQNWPHASDLKSLVTYPLGGALIALAVMAMLALIRRPSGSANADKG